MVRFSNAAIKSLATYDEKNVHKSDDLSVWFFLLACDNNTGSLKHSAKMKNKKKIIYMYISYHLCKLKIYETIICVSQICTQNKKGIYKIC